MHVRGRWIFRPKRWLDVGPATVDANGVDVSYGSHPLATGLHGSVGATVHPFDLRQTDGLAIFHHVSSDGRLRGRAFIADALGLLLPRSGVAFTRWEGPVDGRVTLDHGTFADGTKLRIDSPDGRIEAAGLAFDAPIRTEVRVASGVGSVEARASDLRVSHVGADLARVASTAAAVTSRHLQLAHGFDDARFTLDVGGAETDDVGAWRGFLPSTSPFVFRSGLVSAEGHAVGSLAERRGRVECKLAARRLSVERGSDHLTADLTGDARLRDVSLRGGWAAGDANITSDDVEIRLGRALIAGHVATHVDLGRGTWADRTFDLSGSDVAVHAASAKHADGGAAVLVVPSLEVRAPSLAIGRSGVTGRVSIDVPHAELVGLAGLGTLFALPAGLVLEAGKAQTTLRADVELGSGSLQGVAAVNARGVRARVGRTEVLGNLEVQLRARRIGDSTDLSGSTVEVTDAGEETAAPAGDRWWGRLVLRAATLRTKGGARFDANAHLAAKDATPATVLLSQNTGVPAWIANIFRMPVLDADAELQVAPSSFEARSLVARGGGTSIRVEYARREGRQEGAVLMELGWIDLAYDLSDGATGLVLLGSKGWFERKAGTMRDTANALWLEADVADRLARYAAMTPLQRGDEARALAAECALEVRTCDGLAVESLLRTAADGDERRVLSGITYASLVAAAAKVGTDGDTLDPRVLGSVAEALRIGGESTLDHISAVAPAAAEDDPVGARGKVVSVSGRVSSVEREGPYFVGTLATDSAPVYFVTPFAVPGAPETIARFRGVFVQRYTFSAPHGRTPSLVLVGAFGP
jgi:hypothetical protein